jgi:hypothetical protein
MNVEYSGDNSRLMKEVGAFEFTRADKAIATLFENYREMPPDRRGHHRGRSLFIEMPGK